MRISDWSSDVCSSDLVREESDPPESLRLALRAQRLTGQIESHQLLVLARRDPDFGVNNVCLAAKGNEKIIAVHRPGVRRVSVDGHGQRMEAIAIEAERFEMLVASLDRETCLHARSEEHTYEIPSTMR